MFSLLVMIISLIFISPVSIAIASSEDVPTNPTDRLRYYTSAIVYAYEMDTVVLGKCAELTKDEKYERMLDRMIHDNGPIFTMAQLKFMAAAEQDLGVAGREKVKRQFDDVRTRQLPEELKKLAPTLREAVSYCDSIISNPARHIFLTSFPDAFTYVLNYDIGYQQKIENCEFVASFPIFPEKTNITSFGKSGIRLETPEFEYLPSISASCSYWQSKIPDAAIGQILSVTYDYFSQIGFQTNTTDNISNRDRVVTVVGRGTRSGMQMTLSKSYYIGKRSVLEVTVGEPTDFYPSIITQQFFDNIGHQ